MKLILKYFPGLTTQQKERYESLYGIYREWNDRINVISRKDFDSLYLKHVLHSLAIAELLRPAPSAKILDIGCGGGFPTVPLAIMFPETQFVATDSIGKKITVVSQVCQALNLSNVSPVNTRAEALPEKFDYVVSRAVAPMAQLLEWSWDKIRKGECGSLPNGILALKGGDLTSEMASVKPTHKVYDISEWFSEEFFETKKIVFVEKI